MEMLKKEYTEKELEMIFKSIVIYTEENAFKSNKYSNIK
jgi:hypothetical protein